MYTFIQHPILLGNVQKQTQTIVRLQEVETQTLEEIHMPIPKEVQDRVNRILYPNGNYRPGFEPLNLFRGPSFGVDEDDVEDTLGAFAKAWDATITKGPYMPTA